MKFLCEKEEGKLKFMGCRHEAYDKKVRPCTAQANTGAKSRGILDLNSLLQVRGNGSFGEKWLIEETISSADAYNL